VQTFDYYKLLEIRRDVQGGKFSLAIIDITDKYQTKNRYNLTSTQVLNQVVDIVQEKLSEHLDTMTPKDAINVHIEINLAERGDVE